MEKKGGGLRTNNGQSAASSFNWPSARAAVRLGEAAAPAQGEARHAVSTASSVRGTRRAHRGLSTVGIPNNSVLRLGGEPGPAAPAPVAPPPPHERIASIASSPSFPRIPTRPLPASPPVHVSVLPVPPVPDPSQSIAPRTAPARSAPVVVLPPTNASRRSQPRAFPRIPTRPLPASPPVHVSVLPVPPVPDPSQSIAPRTGAARSAPVVVLPPTNASRRSQPRAFPRIPTTTPAGEPASSRLRSPRPSRPRPLPIHRSPHGRGPLCARRRPAPHERVAAIATPCLPTHPHHDPCRRARQFTSPFSPSLPSQTPPNPSLPARPRPALRPSSSCPPRTRRGDRNPVPSHASPPRPLPASPPVHVSVLPVPPVPDPSQSIAPRTAPARSAPVVVLPPTNASRRSQPRAFPRIPTTTPAGEPASSRLRSPRPSRPRPLPIHRSPHGPGPLCARRRPAPHERVAAIATPCLPTHPHHDPCRRARQFTSPFSPSLPSQTPPNPSLPARARPALRPSSSCPPRTRRGDRNPVPSHASPPRPPPTPIGGAPTPTAVRGACTHCGGNEPAISTAFSFGGGPCPGWGPRAGLGAAGVWQRVGRLQLQVPSCLARKPVPWWLAGHSGFGGRRPATRGVVASS